MTAEALLALQAQIRTAAAAKLPLVIRGGGTKDFYGQAIVGAVLDVTPHAGIVDYDPTELVLTARAGTPLAEVETQIEISSRLKYLSVEQSESLLERCSLLAKQIHALRNALKSR